MSRIGKLPVHLGKGVDCKIVDGNIIVKGPKGEVTMHVLPMVGVDIKDGVVHFTQLNETRESNANMGTMRALVNDMNKGVTVGFEKKPSALSEDPLYSSTDAGASNEIFPKRKFPSSTLSSIECFPFVS